MGRPPSGLDDYLDWQERLENYKASGLEVDVFCLQEGVSSTTAPKRLIFYAKVILEYNINRLTGFSVAGRFKDGRESD